MSAAFQAAERVLFLFCVRASDNELRVRAADASLSHKAKYLRTPDGDALIPRDLFTQ